MKFVNILCVIFVASMSNSSHASKREKRTIGKVLQFLGLKLVPLSDSERNGGFMQHALPLTAPKKLQFSTVLPTSAIRFQPESDVIEFEMQDPLPQTAPKKLQFSTVLPNSAIRLQPESDNIEFEMQHPLPQTAPKKLQFSTVLPTSAIRFQPESDDIEFEMQDPLPQTAPKKLQFSTVLPNSAIRLQPESDNIEFEMQHPLPQTAPKKLQFSTVLPTSAIRFQPESDDIEFEMQDPLPQTAPKELQFSTVLPTSAIRLQPESDDIEFEETSTESRAEFRMSPTSTQTPSIFEVSMTTTQAPATTPAPTDSSGSSICVQLRNKQIQLAKQPTPISPFMIMVSEESPQAASEEPEDFTIRFPPTTEKPQMEISTVMTPVEELIDSRISDDEESFSPLPLTIQTYDQLSENKMTSKMPEEKVISPNLEVPLKSSEPINSEMVNLSQDQPYEYNVPIEKAYKGFEIYRSNDVSDSYFGQQSSHPSAYDPYPQHLPVLQEPAPFTYYPNAIPSAGNRFMSHTSMNMNGHMVNYQTYHH